MTGVLLIWDLRHPLRFYLIFTRHHWRSWLVRGSFIIGAYGAATVAYLPGSLTGSVATQQVMTAAFEITHGGGAQHEHEVPASELTDIAVSPAGRVYTAGPAPVSPNIVPAAAPGPDPQGRRPAGVMVDGVVRRGFPTPSGRLEFWSATLAAWGWPEHALPGYIKSHVHPSALEPGQLVLLSTFRLPTQIHTRSANSKWLDELAHTNPVRVHPSDASRLGIQRTGDLIRVETEIGYFVAKAWITQGIRPGVIACVRGRPIAVRDALR